MPGMKSSTRLRSYTVYDTITTSLNHPNACYEYGNEFVSELKTFLNFLGKSPKATSENFKEEANKVHVSYATYATFMNS